MSICATSATIHPRDLRGSFHNRRLPPQQTAVLVRTGVEAQAAHTLLAVEVRPDAEIMALEAHDLPINTDR